MLNQSTKKLPEEVSSNFVTDTNLRLDKIYIKCGSIVVVEITITDDWNMEGIVLNAAYFPMSYPLILTDAQCKYWLSNRIMPDRKDGAVQELGLTKYDTMEILYRTRGINMLDDYWLAWSKNDNVADYHPRFNGSLIDLCHPGIECI